MDCHVIIWGSTGTRKFYYARFGRAGSGSGDFLPSFKLRYLDKDSFSTSILFDGLFLNEVEQGAEWRDGGA